MNDLHHDSLSAWRALSLIGLETAGRDKDLRLLLAAKLRVVERTPQRRNKSFKASQIRWFREPRAIASALEALPARRPAA